MDFAFNASALGVGGVIERGPVITTIPSLASVALAPTGGEGQSVVTNYYSEELEFSRAETRVFGRRHIGPEGPLYTTFTYVLLQDVRIFDKLKIAEMRSTVTTTRGRDDGDDHEFEVVVSYKGVRIGRKDVDPKVDDRIRKVRKYKELETVVAAGKAARPEDHERALRFNATPEQFVQMVKDKQPVQGSMVQSIEGLEARPSKPTIPVPGLGVVRFGELMLKPGRRRLNLVRIKFGSGRETIIEEGPMPNALVLNARPLEEFLSGPSGGSMTLGSGEGNGTPIGP